MPHPLEVRYRPARDTDFTALLQFVPPLLQGCWSVAVLQQLLAGHQLRVLETQADAQLVGFAEFSVVLDEAELLSLAIHPHYQRRGLGHQLLSALLQEVAAQGVVRMLLEVRSSNSAARRLYARHGFAQDGIRRGYYAPVAAGEPREDACLYSLRWSESSSSRA